MRALIPALFALACSPQAADTLNPGPTVPTGTTNTADADTDADADSDTDADADSDTDADSDADTDTDTGTYVTPTGSTSRRHDCSGIDPADRGPLGGVVALTFDDGPSISTTPEILDVLRAHNAPATFFMLGERLTDPVIYTLVDEMVADPLFDLANHSFDHSDLANVSSAELDDQIDDTNDLLEAYTGAPVDFFRFPYGSSDCFTHDEVTSRGMSVAGWHIDTADWCYAAVGVDGTCTTWDYWRVPSVYENDMTGFTMEQINRFDGGIVLFHDIHQWVADELDSVLTEMESQGYQFVALDDTAYFPNLVAGTPVDLPYLGESCDLSDDLCWQVEFSAWCEPSDASNPGSTNGVCTMECEGYCSDRDGAAGTFCAEAAPGAGQCAGKSEEKNDWCADLPGTIDSTFDRHVGSSGAAAISADICAPTAW